MAARLGEPRSPRIESPCHGYYGALFDLVREMKRPIYNHRLRLVESAKQRSIKPTARLFSTTVRKWLRRFQQLGPSGLLEQSRARHRQAHRTPSALEAQLVELRKTLPMIRTPTSQRFFCFLVAFFLFQGLRV